MDIHNSMWITIMNNVDVDIHVQVFVCSYIFISLEYVFRSKNC